MAFYVAMPPLTFIAVVLWVAGGLWCERNIKLGGSYIIGAVSLVLSLIWGLGMIAGVMLIFGSVAALSVKLLGMA